MFKTIRNAWSIPDLRRKILFTLLIVVVFRLGAVIPVPFLNTDALEALMSSVRENGSALSYLDMLTGGAADLSEVPVAGHGFRWIVF